MLLALDAVVDVASVRGARAVPIDEFYLGVKRSALEPDELIRSVRVPLRTGPCHFAKIGTRNAMVIAVCSFAVALHASDRLVRTGIGSAAPTPVRALDAEAFASAGAASPIDDVRGSARYRRHALAVLARRTLSWAWEEYRSCA